MTTWKNALLSATAVAAMAPVAVSAQGSEEKPEGLSIGVLLGPSIPSDNIANVYDMATTGNTGHAYEVASDLGYHLGARMRLGLTPALSLSGGVQYVRFPGNKLTAVIQSQQAQTLVLNTIVNYVPISAGFTLRPIRSIIDPYVSAEALFTYSNVTLADNSESIASTLLSPGQEVEPTTTRMGAALSAGVEFNLIVLRPFIEFRYIMANLVGTETNEPAKNWLNVSIGLNF